MKLKRPDYQLLQAALKSNGGGVPTYLYSDASVRRLMSYDLIQWKHNQGGEFVSLTKEGKRFIVEYLDG
jgi:hypothetical protein